MKITFNEEQIHEKILSGYNDYLIGNTQNAAEAFERYHQKLKERE